MSEFMEHMLVERETKTLLEAIRALMDTLHSTPEEAMTALGISPEKQKRTRAAYRRKNFWR